ncbi:MAG: hypothetical protein ABR501_06145 [Pyrinomonadaceae bacterium]
MKITAPNILNHPLRYFTLIFLTFVPAMVVAQDFESAPTSRLTGLPLGATAQRVTDKETVSQFAAQLQALATKMQQSCVDSEVLAWAGSTYKRAEAQAITAALAAQMKQAGFVYDEQAAPAQEGSDLKIVAARRRGQTVTGFWIISDQVLMLAWCQLRENDSTQPASVAPRDNSAPTSSLSTLTSQETSPQQVLVAGTPPLTQEMVNRFFTFIEWLLDASLTHEQQVHIRQALKDDWTSKKTGQIQEDMDLLELDASLAQRPAEEREYMRQQLRAQFLKEADLKKEDKNLQWLKEIYESAHQPIVVGNPPLTRQAADAYAELFGFMIAEVAGVPPIEIDADGRDGFVRGIAQGYPKLTMTEKQALAGMPAYWAGLRVAWLRATALERDKLRAQWREQLKAILSPAQFVQLEGAKAFEELSAWIDKAEKGEVKRDELPRIAATMEKAARSLREAGGDQNQIMASRLSEMAKQVSDASRLQSTPATATANSLKKSLNNNHSLYSSIMGRSMVSHYALMGAISRIH